MKSTKITLVTQVLASLIFLQLAVLVMACAGVSDQAAENLSDPPDPPQPLLRDAGFYGINTGIFDIFMTSSAWHLEIASLPEIFSIEASIKIMETSTGDAMSGITFLREGDEAGYNLGLFPNQDRWMLYDASSSSYVTSVHEPAGFDIGRWYTLKATVTPDRIHTFIDGKRKSPPEGFPRRAGSGKAALRVRNTRTFFDNVTLTDDRTGEILLSEDFSAAPEDWRSDQPEAWSWLKDEGNGVYDGSVLLGRDNLISREFSPAMNDHFDKMAAAGAHTVRVFLNWNDIQAEDKDSYYWDYADSIAISAHDREMIVVASLVDTPNWAVAPEFRGEFDSYAFPPRDNADFTGFITEFVKRYKPGGELAREMGWTADRGITHLELGHEFNIGRIYRTDGQIFFSGWIGSLEQYVDYLKVGRDAVKAACPECLVLNGAVADDMPPAYATSRVDPSGWRQYLWQGVEDLYDEIQKRHPGEKDAADRYFDILNIHTYEWFMLSAGGQLPDLYRPYSFPDPLWYRDRLTNVMEVMKRYGDEDKKVWLTETSFASGDSGDAFGGYLSEAGQAEALQMVYEESSQFPQLEKVFWWYAYDTNNKVGLIRRDLSVKPSYDVYSRLTGNAPP